MRSVVMMRLVCCLSFLLVALVGDSYAGDWPTWRYDAYRSASSPDALPEQLNLQWTRELSEPCPAWPPNQHKLQFDGSYEPVVMGKTLFVPSMVTDSVTAVETESGKARWRFVAG